MTLCLILSRFANSVNSRAGNEDVADHKKGWTSPLKKFARLMEQGKVKGVTNL
jgi:hypothetical protein